MKKLILSLALVSLLGTTTLAQNINDCTDSSLVVVGNKYASLIGKEITIANLDPSEATAKVLSVKLTPTVCAEGTITLTKRPKKRKDFKFYSMTIQIEKNGRKSTYEMGYQLFLSALSRENTYQDFVVYLENDAYIIGVRGNGLMLYRVVHDFQNAKSS